MKREMDLIRQILLEVERQPFTGKVIELGIEDHSSEEVSYHIMLLQEAGLIEAVNLSSHTNLIWKPVRLTWQGYEFLEAVKDDARWNRVKDIMGNAGGYVFEVAKAIAVALLKDQISGLLP